MYFKHLRLFFILLFFNGLQITVAQNNNYIDSIEVYLKTIPEKDYLIKLVEIPYDKIVANTSKSEKLFIEGLQLAKKNHNKEIEAGIYSQLATINGFLGNYDKQLEYNINAIHIYEELENKSKAGVTYANLGFSMKDRFIEKSKFYMRKGIQLLVDDKNYQLLNSVYDNYGIVQEISGNVDSAIYFYNKALDLKRNQHDSIGIPFALGHLSGAYLVKKDYITSKIYLDESYAIRNRRNDTYGVAECLVLYGDFYYAQNNYQEAAV